MFTPKGLLRLPEASSKLSDLTEGTFQFVLDDPRRAGRQRQIERLVLCSAARSIYDIEGHERREDAEEGRDRPGRVLYPFAREQIRRADRPLPEPQGGRLGPGGAEEHGRLERHGPAHPELVPEGVEFRYVGRPQRSSPSEGYPAAHRIEQERIVLTALEG